MNPCVATTFWGKRNLKLRREKRAEEAERKRDRGNENEARIYEQEKVKLNSFGQEMILSN